MPATGAAIDLGKMQERYWAPLFRGYEFSMRWVDQHTPDAVFLIYNHHGPWFSLDMIPTFVIGCAERFARVPSATVDNAVNRLWGEVNGVGQNMLGILLMEVRDEIRSAVGGSKKGRRAKNPTIAFQKGRRSKSDSVIAA